MKKAIITGIIVFFIGIALQIFALFKVDFNIFAMFSENLNEKTVSVQASIDEIQIDGGHLDIKVLPSDNGECRIVFYENENLSYSVSTENHILKIDEKDNRKWYDYLVFSERASVKLYLPEEAYNSIDISTTSGDVFVSGNLTFNIANLESSSGDLAILSNTVDSLSVQTTGGDGKISWNNTKTVNIKTKSGDIEIQGVGGENIAIESHSGDIEGNIMGPMEYICDGFPHEVEVPLSSSGGGQCRIKTRNGEIDIE